MRGVKGVMKGVKGEVGSEGMRGVKGVMKGVKGEVGSEGMRGVKGCDGVSDGVKG